ncbi:ZZ-type zinc finger-containing protein 3-like isoform X1 [Rhizophagus irregularis DAOM 181602=DAOM 197198]|nr:ZZ-type zinc finger-containing protein 3-like isoform X1 [Rhizophagus irregularis DAOM 181602=DAOM 197198]
MSPIAFDNTIIEKNSFETTEYVEYVNGLTKDSTKSCMNQEQPQQQQPQPQLEQEQERNYTITVEQPQKEEDIVEASSDMMQIDEPRQDISNSEQKLDQQNSSPQQLPQPLQEIQQEVTQIKQTNSENVETNTTNSNGMESVIEISTEETLLNGNEDYEMVLRAVNVLKFQLEQTKEDIKKIKDIKQRAISDPEMFIEKLRDGTHEKIPERQYIFGVPQVDWSKYHTRPSQYKPPPRPGREVSKSSTSDDEKSPDPAEFVHKKAQEALGAIRNESASAVSNRSTFNTPITIASTSYSPTLTSSNRRNNKKKSSDLKLSEGSPKTGNYNIPWTDEEQRRLVELLAIYPDEEIQSHRFKKISEALGTRTPKQVASRVQKYFIKLAKHGLPVPGRIPNVSFAAATTKNSQPKNKKTGRASKPKSILPSEKKPRHLRISGLSYLEARPPPTVYMPDDDDESSIKNVMMSVGRPQDDNIHQMCNFITGPVHYGFCCDGCHMDPIIGTRYLCNECDESHEVDLCEECFVEESFENEYHKKTHKFTLITNPITPHIDKDYVPENVGEYNYLGVAPPSTS